MGWLQNLIGRAPSDTSEPAPPQSLDLIERSVDVDGLSSRLSSGLYRSSSSSRKGSEELIGLYRESPWLRAVAHKVGHDVAAVQWRLYARQAAEPSSNGQRSYVMDRDFVRLRGDERRSYLKKGLADGDLVEISSHPLLRLFDRPNPMMTGYAARAVTIVHYDLLGEWFWILERDQRGMPIRFWPIPPTWVKEVPTQAKPSFRVSLPDFEGLVPITDMLWGRDVDPGDPYNRGVGLGMALADELDIDEHAAKHVAAWFQNRGMPDMLVSLKGARQEVVDRAKLRWEKALRGFQRAYQTYFTGAEIDVKRLDTSFKDMSLVDIRKNQRDIVVSTWGMPPEKLGILQNSNKATITASDLIEQKGVVLPRLEMLRMELQTKLIPFFDPRLLIEFDDPVPEDREEALQAMQVLSGRFTVNEERDVAGHEPLPESEGGDGFLVPAGLVWVRKLEDLAPKFDQAAIAAGLVTNNEARIRLGLSPTSAPWGPLRASGFVAPMAQLPPPASPEEPVLDDEDEELEALPGLDDVELETAPAVGAAPIAASALNGAQISSLVEIVQLVASGELSKESAKAIIAAAFPMLAPEDIDAIIDPVEARVFDDGSETAATAAPPRAGEVLSRDEVLARTHSLIQRAIARSTLKAILAGIDKGSMAGALEPVVGRLMREWGNESIKALDSSLTFDLKDPRVEEHLKGFADERVERLINGTTRDMVRAAVYDWDGESVDDLVAMVGDIFDRARLERSAIIASVEGQRTAEFASTTAMKQSGIVARKEWIAVADGRTREAHLDLDGQVQDLEKPFVVEGGRYAGAKAQQPGAFGIGALDINCRCHAAPVFDPDDDGVDTERSARLIARGFVPERSTVEQRKASWTSFDEALKPWDRRLSDAAQAGFDAQQENVAAAINKLLR